MKFTHFLVFSGVLAVVSATAIIDPNLKKRSLGDTQNVMVTFSQGMQTVFQQINRMNFSSPQLKRTALTKAQQSFTNTAQAPLKTMLSTAGVKYKSFWINNKMVIPNVNSALVNAIASVPGVAKIEKEPVVNLNPLRVLGEPQDFSNSNRYRRQASVEWGISKIRADKVWDSFKGKGIVVANIDTGVRVTHEALKGRWRESYGWFDPDAFFPFLSRRPSDRNGHGTHTMGTIVGSQGVGVAPEATWIACRGCTSLGCTSSALMGCGQWVQCPTDIYGNNPNCSMAPDIVSNSWGGGQGADFYDGVITSWQTSGIIPIFSIGNSGPNCGTANSPGDRPNVISVGSTDKMDKISSFSSLGPSVDGVMQPTISAPGGDVRSAWYTGDSAYQTISGTSMSAPHLAGVVALMLQKTNKSATYDDVYTAITSTAVRENLDGGSPSQECGNITIYPNNVFGYGRVDAKNSVDALGKK